MIVHPNWQEYSTTLVKPWDYWLGVPASLTQALADAGGERCDLTVQQEGYAEPWVDECEFLEIDSNNHQHWIREIVLSQPKAGQLVYARSVFPQELLAQHQEFLKLGNNVLAQVLFDDPHIYRGDIEVAQLGKNHELFNIILSKGLVAENQQLWARRSRFHVRNHQLLVCEVMLNAVKDL